MPAPFVGRHAEMQRLEEALSSLEAGGRSLFITGEPGIGKSRLIEELAKIADAGAFVAVGRAWEAEGTPPHRA